MTDEQRATLLRAAEGGYFAEAADRWWDAEINSEKEAAAEEDFNDLAVALLEDESIRPFLVTALPVGSSHEKSLSDYPDIEWANKLWSFATKRHGEPF